MFRVLLPFIFMLMTACQQGTPPEQADTLWLNGRIEGEHAYAATKVPGRINSLKVEAGDTVKAGQVVALLDDRQIRAQVAQARSALEAAQASENASRTALDVFRKEVRLKLAQAESALKHARAQLEAAKVRRAQAERDEKRMRTLFNKKQISREQWEKARLTAQLARADERTAAAAVEQARKAVDTARLGFETLKAKEAELAALRARTEQARSALEAALSQQADMRILAPIDGVVVEKLAHTGEVLAPGAVLFDIVDLDKLYFQGYVPEYMLGRVHLGQPAHIQVDAWPERTFSAKVGFISDQAAFTPKDVQTRDERVKQVFKVKLYLDENPQRRLKPGMPADAEIDLNE